MKFARDPRAQHEQGALATLKRSLNAIANDLAAAGVRAELQPICRDAKDGPFSSELSVVLWTGDNVADCLVFEVWRNGRPVPIADITRSIHEELADFVARCGHPPEAAGGGR